MNSFNTNMLVKAGFNVSLMTLALAGMSNANAEETAKTPSLSQVNKTEIVEVIGQTAQLEKALKDQRASDSIENVVHSDAIGQLPDDNAAEALQRMPGISIERDQGEGRFVTIRGLGPDLNNVNINGATVPSPESGRRAVALDVLPAELVQSLSVVKTLTPDMDGSAFGGTVNVKSLSAFDHKGFYYTLNGEAGYNQLVSETSPKVSGAVSNLFSVGEGTNNLGVALALSYQNRKFGSENVETGGAWDLEDGAALLGEFESRDYAIERERIGAGLNIDFKPDNLTNLYLRTFYSRFADDEQRNAAGIEFADALSEGALGDEAEGFRELKDREEVQKIKSLVLGGDKSIGLWTVASQFAFSEASEENSNAMPGAKFEGEFNNIGFASSKQPVVIGTSAFNDLSAFDLDEVEMEDAITKDRVNSFKIDLARIYDMNGYESEVKFGAKFSRRKKTNKQTTYAFDEFDGFSTSLTDYMDGSVISPSKLRSLVANFDRNDFIDEEESRINDYEMHEDINAAYVMNTIDIDKLRLIGGVRYEGTDFEAKGTSLIDEEFGEVDKKNSYHQFLPSLHAKYLLNDATQLRAAFTSNVVRPAFEQLAPGIVIEDDEAEFGNPDLDPMRAKNFDIGFERYMGTTGSFSVYGFYKDITDFVYQTDIAGTPGAFADFGEAITYQNGDSAKVYGVEISYTQKFDWLPFPMNGLIVGANATFSDSDANITQGGFTREIRLPNHSKEVGNLMLGWQNDKVNVRLSGNYKSEYLSEVGDIEDKAQDIYADSQLYVDLSASYFFTPNVQLTFEAQNLTDEEFYFYQSASSYNAQRETYGRTYRVSLTLTDF